MRSHSYTNDATLKLPSRQIHGIRVLRTLTL